MKTGHVIDIKHEIINGFLAGLIKISNLNQSWNIMLKNEYLFVKDAEKDVFLAETPDIISLVECSIWQVLTSEKVSFVAKVHIICTKAADIWYTDAGLN